MKIKDVVLVVSAVLPEEIREHNGKEYKKTIIEFTDTDDHDYPADYGLELAPARYKLLEGLESGDKVRVTVSITGKKGTKGVFHTLRLLELSIIEKGNGAAVSTHSHQVSGGAGFAAPAQQSQSGDLFGGGAGSPTATPGPNPLDDLPF